jgi:iron complex outermembrane receptor protein
VRLGYIFVPSKKFYGKILAADYFTPPSFFELSTNPNLKKQRSRLVGTELNYIIGNNKFLFSGAYVSVKDNISLHPIKLTYFNFGKKVEYFLYSIDYEYKFNKFNKIMVNYYYADISQKDFILGTREGGFLKIFNNFDKLNIYLELSYKKGYFFKPLNIRIKDGYDLIVGVNYNLDESTIFSIKGENLLNKALKTPYLGINPVVTPSVDKKVLVSLKRFF